MRLVNLTPHAVTIVNEDGAIIATYPSEGEARIAQTNAPSGVLDGVPICKVAYGEAIGLPEPQPDTGYIVSYITVAQLKLNGARTVNDLYYPTEMVRDEKGRIIGSRYLAWGGGAETKADRIRKSIMNAPHGIPRWRRESMRSTRLTSLPTMSHSMILIVQLCRSASELTLLTEKAGEGASPPVPSGKEEAMKVYLVVETEFNRYDADDVYCYIFGAYKSREKAKRVVSEIKVNSPFPEEGLAIVELKAGTDYRENPIYLIP